MCPGNSVGRSVRVSRKLGRVGVSPGNSTCVTDITKKGRCNGCNGRTLSEKCEVDSEQCEVDPEQCEVDSELWCEMTVYCLLFTGFGSNTRSTAYTRAFCRTRGTYSLAPPPASAVAARALSLGHHPPPGVCRRRKLLPSSRFGSAPTAAGFRAPLAARLGLTAPQPAHLPLARTATAGPCAAAPAAGAAAGAALLPDRRLVAGSDAELLLEAAWLWREAVVQWREFCQQAQGGVRCQRIHQLLVRRSCAAER